MSASANVSVVRPVHCHEREDSIHEYRAYHGEVRQVRPSKVGVIEKEHVTRRDAVSEVVQHCASGNWESANVYGYALALRDEPALAVQYRGRKVSALRSESVKAPCGA